MAVTKIWAIKDSLQRVLDYAANPDKTEYDALAQTLHYAENDAKTKLNESAQLVTGIHCRANHAWEDMRAVQERFGKTDGVVALHAYQSFREGEITPEQCHEIGVALVRKVWDKRFQVLVATHMNTDNLHNHFVINSVSYVDGKKYEQRRSQYAEFRAASDKLCREYGLSVVEQPKAKEPARYARMREAIDQACEDASTAEDFHRALYRQGYIFSSDPNRRYATIRARDGGRAVRLYRLGEEYDLAAIDDRLRGIYLLYGAGLYERKHPPRQYTPKWYRPKDGCAGKGVLQIFFEVFFGESQMHRLYLYYCYQMGILPKKQQPHINRPELERIWKDTEKILAEHAFVHYHKFPSLQAIVDYRKSLSQQMETLAAQRSEVVKQTQGAGKVGKGDWTMMKKIKLTRANKSITLKALAPYYYQQRALGHSTQESGRLILKINSLSADKKASFSAEEIHLMRTTVNQLRNEQLAKGQYTDAADDMLLKLF